MHAYASFNTQNPLPAPLSENTHTHTHTHTHIHTHAHTHTHTGNPRSPLDCKEQHHISFYLLSNPHPAPLPEYTRPQVTPGLPTSAAVTPTPSSSSQQPRRRRPLPVATAAAARARTAASTAAAVIWVNQAAGSRAEAVGGVEPWEGVGGGAAENQALGECMGLRVSVLWLGSRGGQAAAPAPSHACHTTTMAR
jgi:hypothetical protein